MAQDKKLSPEQERTYYILLLIMIISGTLNTIFLRLQSRAYDYIYDAPFQHPWVQSIIMFIGESYCAILWFIFKDKIKKEEAEDRLKNGEEPDTREEAPVYLFLISCMCDVVGSTLLNFALIMMASSVFQMLRGGVIIVTCIFTIIFLKRNPKNYQWLGVGLVFLGVFLVGLASQQQKDGNQVETKVLGIILLIASLLFSGFQFVYQEIILVKYRCESLQLVAWEGLWGMIVFIILLPCLEWIPCDFNGKVDICSMDEDGDYYVENTIFAIKQIFAHAPLFFYCFLQSISIAAFNYYGIMIVKYASSATRSVMDSTRTVLVWAFFLFVPVQGKTEEFMGLQLCGFVILIFGQLIYNTLITVNFLGFNSHKLKEIASDVVDDVKSGENKEDVLLNTQQNISIVDNEKKV